MSRIRGKAHEFLSAYEHMNNIMETKFGYSLYFIGGTLLGYIRENDFLENDKDMDVSWFSKYTNVFDVRKELFNIVDTLIVEGEQLYFIRNSYSVVNKYFRWRVDEEDRIDIMPTWCQDGMIYRPTFVAYEGSRDIILPLKKEKFYGHDIFLPNKPELKLANVYGEDWKIPNAGFKKKSRKNIHSSNILENQLSFTEEAWKFAKRTQQWKDFSTLEKIFMNLIVKQKIKIIAKILPERKWFTKKFKILRHYFIKKK
ncbi:MAG TPA: hypothetical protein DCY00_08560 [Actinobacteria bacterium]|nr:hypothetical protein [Actinomycetota bacterium]